MKIFSFLLIIRLPLSFKQSRRKGVRHECHLVKRLLECSIISEKEGVKTEKVMPYRVSRLVKVYGALRRGHSLHRACQCTM